MVLIATKTIVGWEEWISLPGVGLPLVKAKVDTGAKTSSIHAFDIKKFKKGGTHMVSFKIHPVQKSSKFTVECTAELADERFVTDSGGHREMRCVIKTTMIIGRRSHEVEVTLADRGTMAFRMLLGREAMGKARLIVDPAKSCCLGKRSKQDVLRAYQAAIPV